MQFKRNLYYARKDHVQWSRVKVDGFGSKIPTEQSAGAKLVGKKAEMDGQLLIRGWLRSKMVKSKNRWHHVISYPRNPLDMNVQPFF